MLIAALLVPALPAGHRGLPCPLRTLTGIPCPLCGMSTSVVAAVHLHLHAAVVANPAGPVAVLFAIGLLILRRATRLTVPSWLMPAGLAVMEVWEMARFRLL
jgi:hypothetical protein